MRTLKISITTISVLLLALLASACQPIQQPAESVAQAADDEERLFFTFMVAGNLDTREGHYAVIEGHGTFNPNDLTDVEAEGVFQMFDRTMGKPEPMVHLGVGSWKAKHGVAFNSPGSYAAATAGVLDLVIDLIPDEGEPVEATLRVICNVPQVPLINTAEDGSNLPEGIFLTVPELGTFEPIISDQPGVPPVGLTLIGPTTETRLKRKADNQ